MIASLTIRDAIQFRITLVDAYGGACYIPQTNGFEALDHGT
jgi:hypothetical protein